MTSTASSSQRRTSTSITMDAFKNAEETGILNDCDDKDVVAVWGFQSSDRLGLFDNDGNDDDNGTSWFSTKPELDDTSHSQTNSNSNSNNMDSTFHTAKTEEEEEEEDLDSTFHTAAGGDAIAANANANAEELSTSTHSKSGRRKKNKKPSNQKETIKKFDKKANQKLDYWSKRLSDMKDSNHEIDLRLQKLNDDMEHFELGDSDLED